MVKVLWSSNAPWSPTGYGVQTKYILRGIRDLGYPVACQAWWGLEGGPTEWEGIRMYPRHLDGYGNDAMPYYCRQFKADVLITLIDLWVMDTQLGHLGNTRYCPYFPLDSADPIAPAVAERFNHAHRLIVYSKYAEREVKNYQDGKYADRVRYVPHGCVAPDTRVITEKGIVTIEQAVIEKHQSVLTLVGTRAVSASIRAWHKIPLRDSHCLSVSTSLGHRLIITRDNLIMTQRGEMPAGDLTVGDRVCILPAEGVTYANRQVLEPGGNSHSRAIISRSKCRGITGSVAREGLGCDKAQGRNTQTTTYQSRPTVCQVSSRLQINAGGSRLFRRDCRWRGIYYINQSQQASKRAASSIASQSHRGHLQSIRSFDSLDDGSSAVQSAGVQARFDRMGMGLQACDFRVPCLSVAEMPTTISGYQGPPSRYCDSVLRAENDQTCGRVLRGDRISDDCQHQGAECCTQADAHWDRIVAIESVSLPTVYDLTTDTSSFIANGILIHNCDTEVLRPASDEEKAAFRRKYFPDWPADAFIAGMVAANKGHPARKSFPEVMEAFAMFAQNHPEARLYLHSYAASDFKGPDLQQMAVHYGITDKTRLANPRMLLASDYSDEMMREIYCSLDVLLSPSQGEGFGLPVIEAQAAGTSVIVNDHSAQSELVGCGWRVKPLRLFPSLLWSKLAEADPAGVHHALEECYRRPKSPHWASIAREFALSYSWPTVIKSYWAPFLAELDGGRRELALELEEMRLEKAGT